MRERFPELDLQLLARDFATLSGLSDLDGIIMANSLHFQRDAQGILSHAKEWLTPGGKLVIVEYDVAWPNPWVPFPVPFRQLYGIAEVAGLTPPRLMATRPSRYHGRVYSAIALRPTGPGVR